MSSMNGGLTPAPPGEPSNSTISLSAKRKRDDSIDLPNNTNGTTDYKGAALSEQSVEASQALIRDLIDVMKADDTTPSILSRALPDRPSSSGPQAKRQKSAENSDTSTSILTRLLENTYNKVDEVLQDIDTAVDDIMDKLQLSNASARNQFIPVSATHSEISIKATAFKQRAHELVARELAATGRDSSLKSNGSLVSNVFTQINAKSSGNKMVLTLYGNAPGPKQLFSSLQLPTKINGEKSVIPVLREAGLPNGINTTQIVPIQATGLAEDKKRIPTLGELFPTPSTVPALQPPKPSKIATTRSSTVGWYQPAVNESLSRSASYFKQSITTGQWLDYSNTSPFPQGAKRKQRDRALSLVGAKAPSLEAEPAESDASKLDALFRGAYSSFAPTRDDSAAVVPVGVMNRLWWQQAGQKNFGKLVENWNNMEAATNSTPAPENEVKDDEEIASFEKVIEDLENDMIDPSLVNLEAEPAKSAEEKDVEEIIEGISELLETLNSYQRIRHMSLNPSSRPAGLLSAHDTTSLGTPSKPSEPEQATYEILRSQLTLMIASLPPYAVAKLDPDQLADLAISTKIEIRANNYKGVMEEDEATARAKVAALTAASTAPRPAAPAPLHRSSSSSLYGNQYSATPVSRPVPSATPQYYGASQTPVRAPSNNFQRPPATAPVPYMQRPAGPGSAPYRPGPAYGTPTYPHQAPRPISQPYAASSQPQHPQTSTGQNFMRAPSQSYQPATQPPLANGRYPSQPQSAYAHQAQVVPTGLSYPFTNNTNANLNRQHSPQKMYSPQPQNTQPRAGYSTPTPSTSQDRRPFLQNAINHNSLINGSVQQQTRQGAAQQSNQQAPQQPSQQRTQQPSQQQYVPQSSSGYSTFLSMEQQANLMDRTRALAQQQADSQPQARDAAQAAMGSPSKAQINGGNPVAAGT